MIASEEIWASAALTAEGWLNDVRISVDETGRIAEVSADRRPRGHQHSVVIPAPANLHSHAFQRAMAGLSESRIEGVEDNFWGWRQLMYRFLARLTPEDVEAVAAFVQMEMLEAGFGSVVEFHYLHNDVDGSAYREPAEMSLRILAAAAGSGIGLTLLPVLYEQGGCDGRELVGPQKRFRADVDFLADLCDEVRRAAKLLSLDAGWGTAVHSLRAATPESMAFAERLAPDRPFHLHVAEQPAEVGEVKATLGRTPVEWLVENFELDERWCLVHCTQMNERETATLAQSGAVAGLCPITESNLGDGAFDGSRFFKAGGRLGVGSDSNVRISQSEEYRTLEYSQRLRDRMRCVLTDRPGSVGRQIFDRSCVGGALAAGRDCGSIRPGCWADLLELDAADILLEGLSGDALLDAWIFAGSDRLIRNVWSAGRHLVRSGVHIRRPEILGKYRLVQRALRRDE
ncbi:MAG: formimidoylglutamate deiminase [Rhodobacteraceae bacterium]|nr:formimidoylglutamate deiminase [Paracoccaceae bacterium]